MCILKCWGDFGGATPKSVFTIIWYTLRCPPYNSRQQTLQSTPSLLVTSFICGCFVSTSMAASTSTIAINAEQLANSPHLEPAIEHLLNVHESIISILRVNAVADRDTFVGLFDTEAALKEWCIRPRIRLNRTGSPAQAGICNICYKLENSEDQGRDETADRCRSQSSRIASYVASV